MHSELNNKVLTATKWSATTEIVAKLVTPITSMVLARLLTPEAFGVVTTLTMVITFAELFTDAGFQKYLVQHDFKDDKDRDESTTVAFWSNLILSIVVWGIISVFNRQIAILVGSPGLGHVLIIACASIPLAAFSSIQSALFRRDLDFRTLFKVRIVSTIIPLLITVPLAFYIRNYWALVIGTLTVNTVNAILLTIYSKWKPRFFYSLTKFKEMFSFTFWSVLEAISIWLTRYVDVFIVGTMLSQYYLGLYKTSSALVGQIMGIVTAITTPILFSALSRLQNDEDGFKRLFFRFQKIVGLLVIPLGFGIFLFKDFVTTIILGDQWTQCSGFVGLWALTSSVVIVLSHYSSEIYRSKGKPKLSVLSQFIHICFLWPTVLISVNYGFESLYISRSVVRLTGIVINLCIMGVVVKMPVGKMIINVLPSCVAALSMGLVLLLPSSEETLMNLLYACIAALIYIIVIYLFPEERRIIKELPGIINIRG